jgi:hypothetical protein
VFHFRGLHRSLENLLLFSQTQWPAAGVRTHRELKTAYNKHLATLQPDFTTTHLSGAEIVTEVDVVEKLVHLYADEDDPGAVTEEIIQKAKAKLDPARIAHQRKQVEDGLATLHAGNPRLSALFDLAINRVFFFEFDAAYGGSNSRCIGVIWANPILSWSAPDMAEFCLHELTHNLVFLEEIVHPLYRDFATLNKPENFALSAIRKVPRRLDLVVHSLLVGIEVLIARDRWLGETPTGAVHPPSSKLADDCRAALRSIRSIPGWEELFQPNGHAILQEVGEALDHLPVGAA